MQTLEKILQEIEAAKKEPLFRLCDYTYSDRQNRIIARIEEIIRSHMEEELVSNPYKLNEWIPWDGKNFPPEGELVEVTVKPKILKTPRRDIGYYDRDREEWWKYDDDGLLDVIAWKMPTEPYKPEK